MRAELVANFGIPENKASVIPFGINSTVPDTALTTADARQRLGLGEREKVLLFFGNIAPYKGVEFLVDAFIEVARRAENYRLIIAGRPKGSEAYWAGLQEKISASPVRGQIILKIEYVPDAETEIYFKAADVLVLPYTHIFQSGVLFLGCNFGLPVIAADVGALKDEIVAGETGFVFRPQDASDLARTIEQYFASELYRNLDIKRQLIRNYANERYSWTKVGEITCRVYSDLLVR
jgi:glycosyltransferase involved in cell wall biosynthesis